jgi:hypothetical protein
MEELIYFNVIYHENLLIPDNYNNVKTDNKNIPIKREKWVNKNGYDTPY